MRFNSLNLGGKAPRCPLCHEFMDKKFDPTRGFFIFACDTVGSCKIALRVDDPFIGRWDEALHKTTEGAGIPCPRPECGRPVRYFATSTGFVKIACPKCKATMSNAEPDRDKNRVTTPDAPGALQ